MAATPIPPILDQDRYVRYEPVAPMTDFDVPFPYFGTDASELLVLIDGVKTTAFTVVSRSAGALASAVLPVEDAVVRLAAGVSGVAVEIYGSIRPRRTVQATAAFGTRDFNFVFSYVVAALREMWAQFTRAIQVPPGETTVILPASSDRAGKVLGFNASGKPTAVEPSSGGAVGTSNLLDDAVTTSKVLNGAITLPKLAAVLRAGTAGSLIQWATGPKYPAGDGSDITAVNAAKVGGAAPGSANGDIAIYGVGGKLPAAGMPSGSVIGSASAAYTTAASLAAAIPAGSTKPQITQGTEILSVSYMPKIVGSKLRCRFSCFGAGSAASVYCTAALFINGAADAVRTAVQYSSGGGGAPQVLCMEYEMTVSALSSHTISVRAGPSTGTFFINQMNAVNWGGTGGAVLIVEEIAP